MSEIRPVSNRAGPGSDTPDQELALDFLAGMRSLSASVTLITAMDASQRNGCTATAVCSVTTEPPTLLVCLNRSASSYPLVVRERRFAVNILRPEHRDIALRFASGDPGDSRFSDPRWMTGDAGLPVLSDALASFECEVANTVSVGSHDVFFGRVLAVRHATGNALLYGQGDFGAFTRLISDLSKGAAQDA